MTLRAGKQSFLSQRHCHMPAIRSDVQHMNTNEKHVYLWCLGTV
jgi:hypothetical protein